LYAVERPEQRAFELVPEGVPADLVGFGAGVAVEGVTCQRVADQGVDGTSEVLRGLLDQATDGRGVGDVGLQRDGPSGPACFTMSSAPVRLER